MIPDAAINTRADGTRMKVRPGGNSIEEQEIWAVTLTDRESTGSVGLC